MLLQLLLAGVLCAVSGDASANSKSCLFDGAVLTNSTGHLASCATLSGYSVALYFSADCVSHQPALACVPTSSHAPAHAAYAAHAHGAYSCVWILSGCPLCRRFTPALRDFHRRWHGSVEIVFVSSDETAAAAQSHFQRGGNWLYLAYDDPLAAQLKKRYRVWSGRETWQFGFNRRSGVPCVVVINPAGDELAFLQGERFGQAVLREWEGPTPETKWPNLGKSEL